MKPGLHHIDISQTETLCNDLRKAGWRVFVLPHGIADRESFFTGVRETIPLDPPVAGNRVWDALSDSMWSGLDSLGDHRLAIIWPEAAVMADENPDEYAVALGILTDLVESLGDVQTTMGRPKELLVGLA